MLKLFEDIKGYIKRQEIVTDNALFRLHYMFTTALLLVFSLIVTANQFIGNPIECVNDGGVSTDIVNVYCWISSTFSMPDAFYRDVGSEVAYPGVGNSFQDEKAKKYVTYYQWVCFVLFFQAVMCYIPKFLWDAVENKLMETIVMGLHTGLHKEEDKEKKKKQIIDYMFRYFRGHGSYAYKYFFCETLCLINIVLQMFIMNRFLGGEFIDYGIRAATLVDMDQEERSDPMIYVFPRMTKCTFHRFGSSGTIQRIDNLCVIPQNIINEKAYIIIWFWYIILLIMLCVLIIYRLVIIFAPGVRLLILDKGHPGIPRDSLQDLHKQIDVGDWWVLHMLGRNIDPFAFKDIVIQLSKKYQTLESN